MHIQFLQVILTNRIIKTIAINEVVIMIIKVTPLVIEKIITMGVGIMEEIATMMVKIMEEIATMMVEIMKVLAIIQGIQEVETMKTNAMMTV